MENIHFVKIGAIRGKKGIQKVVCHRLHGELARIFLKPRITRIDTN